MLVWPVGTGTHVLLSSNPHVCLACMGASVPDTASLCSYVPLCHLEVTFGKRRDLSLHGSAVGHQ